MRNSTASNVNVSQTATLPTRASFTFTPSSGFAPLNVSFTDTSLAVPEVTGWSWDFGDGNFADDNGMQNPNHVYEIPGTYTVTLTAMTIRGNLTSSSSTVTVTKAPPPSVPVARFTANQTSGTAPLAVAFDATTSTSDPAVWATWRWSFGDGTFSSVQNPTHTYSKAGLYTVSLTATNLGGSNTATIVNYINISNRSTYVGTYTSGVWHLDTNGNGIYDAGIDATAFFGGMPGDIPVAGSWDGSGIGKVGIFRSGYWFVDWNGNGAWDAVDAQHIGYFGANPGDIPVVGDWDASGISKVGIFRSGYWFVDWNGNGAWDAVDAQHIGYFGANPGDIPVVGDWDASGISKFGIFRSGYWFVDWNGNGAWDAVDAQHIGYFGANPGDIPVVGDWDGNGISKIGVFPERYLVCRLER